MHIPDGFLSLPVTVGTISAASLYGVYAHRKVSNQLQENDSWIPKIACSAAFIFAAQMLNFPVLAGTSGHFMGGAFSTILFGPYIAFFLMAIVLLIQALFFADGGLLAYGGNLLLMGVIAPQVAHLSMVTLKRFLASFKSRILVSSLLSVVASAFCCSIFLFLSGAVSLKPVLLGMVSVHLLIGLGEGIITVSAISFLKSTRSFSLKELSYECE